MNGRIACLDALRGLTVLVWLLSTTVEPVLYQLPQSPVVDALSAQLSPSFWQGFTAFDLVLPMFLFVAGASIVPAFEKRKAAGESNRQIVKRVLRRVVLLLAIGIVCEGGIWQHWPNLRFVGAFQRIAICYVVAACLELGSSWRFQSGVVAFLLLDYWLILRFGSSGGADPYSIDGNATAAFDQWLLPGRKYFGTWDPEGILTTIPAVAITVAGLVSGYCVMVLQARDTTLGLWFIGLGIAVINLAFALDLMCPINPFLWTTPFCLLTIGVSLALLGGLHVLLRPSRALVWGTPLLALGRNALMVILVTLSLDRLVTTPAWQRSVVQSLFCQGSARTAFAVLTTLAAIIMALWLDRRRFYITV